MEFSENKPIFGDRIQCDDKKKWTIDNNHNIRNFTEDEIERITNNYRTPIGEGGFGEVYRGVLDDDDDHQLVAVKRYIRGDLREEFMEEVNIHSQINHKNVVKLIGYCIGESTLTMVTEFISKGNLDDTLHNSDISIPLDTRLGIAIGCADALSYIHSMHLSAGSLVWHGDIKPANILLDNSLTTKVSDFGLSKLLSGGITRSTKNVRGSLDYMDPVYLREGRITPKNDVYSFGAVLLELIARKRVNEGDTRLIATFSKAYAKGIRLRELFDAKIAEECNMKILEKIVKLAMECLTLDIHKRPGMNRVTERLLMFWKSLHGEKANIGRDGQGTSSVRFTSSMLNLLGISHRKPVYSGIGKKLGNIRIFTRGELYEVTQNYSFLIGEAGEVKLYRGTLEDNTLVAVRICHVDLVKKDEFANKAMFLSQIIHKNIIKLLGCCLEDEMAILVYEHAFERNLSGIIQSNEDFPLEFRLNIAVKTAEALAYLHKSAASVMQHGFVKSSNIFVDDKSVPKLSYFFNPMKFTEDGYARHVIERVPHKSSPNIKSDVYYFGIVLLELISRKINPVNPLDVTFITTYRRDKSGKALFDNEITAQENITVLDEIGRVAVECISMNADERPTMTEVAEELEKFRSSWQEKRRAGEHLA